ncbi:beta/gamma crystallin family protein [Actinoplanes sp. TRM 88003]|uniref:Beta/gamma crystallin family protein n=1 Tax=Paractinoplanes aksuensis TaxID=2939490 RepID=A0ABT1DX63_9ACTN|nr:beta/gamma crystallin-related protein [Actinoplanes aksuensis]MCO8275465.1 beta/gamma crystallin family protein [Actinoplanes aksuensis]
MRFNKIRRIVVAAVVMGGGLMVASPASAMPDARNLEVFSDAYRLGIYKNIFATKEVRDFGTLGLNDKVSSIATNGVQWCFFDHVNFGGDHFVMGTYQYRGNLTDNGWNDRISSARVC